MRRKFKAYDPDQLFLLPPDLRDWLPSNHLAYFFNDVVEQLDLSPIYAAYPDDMGQPPYDPTMMLKVWLYGFSQGIRSSRRLEKALHEIVAFRILSGNQQPDHWTLSDYRRRHLKAMEPLFAQSIQLAVEAGLVSGRHVAIDGTKVKAHASKHAAMSYLRMGIEEKRLREQVRRYFDEVEANDREEDRLFGKGRGDELPEWLDTAEKRLEAIKKAKKALEERARQKAEDKDETSTDDAPKPPVAPKRQRKPQARPEPKDQLNFTDPDSRIMRNSDKAFVQAYNAQIAVDSDHQIIVAATLTNQAADNPHLIPLVNQMVEQIGVPTEISADAGYWSETNLQHLDTFGIESFIPAEKIRHTEWRERIAPRGRPPANATRRQRMARKLSTKRGRARYTLRQTTVEPTFGQIKEGRGLRQFLLRGLEKVPGLWHLECLVHNLIKIFRAGGQYAPAR